MLGSIDISDLCHTLVADKMVRSNRHVQTGTGNENFVMTTAKSRDVSIFKTVIKFWAVRYLKMEWIELANWRNLRQLSRLKST
jgi:hypothetical protein